VRSAILGALLAALICLPGPVARAELDDSRLVQYLLLWTGDYTGSIDGVIAGQSNAAYRKFLVREFGKVPRKVQEKHHEALVNQALLAMARAVFMVRNDASLGVTYGVPEALVDRVPTEDRTRILYRSKDGDIEIAITYFPDTYASIGDLYKELRNAEGRKVTSASLKAADFTISANDGPRRFYARYHGEDGEIRGFTVSYEAAKANTFGRVVMAMSAAFRPTASGDDPLVSHMKDLQHKLFRFAPTDTKPDAPQ
jgi:hypothetical protein